MKKKISLILAAIMVTFTVSSIDPTMPFSIDPTMPFSTEDVVSSIDPTMPFSIDPTMPF